MKIKDKKTTKINMTETFENSLKKYFKKQKNIDYILKKTEGPNQASKIYEILCLLSDPNNENMKNKLMVAISFIKKNNLGWSHPTFEKEKLREEEENDFMVCPYEISVGVLQCHKCKCRKIFSFSKQTRSIDEPMTVFALCSECGNKWCEGS